MPSYCSVDDLYVYGVPRGALAEPARPVAAIDGTADTLAIVDHGWATGAQVQVCALNGGVLPTGLAARTTYYVIRLDASTLQLALTSGGPAIDIGSGTPPVGIYGVLDTVATAAIAYVSQLADSWGMSSAWSGDPAIKACVAKIAAAELYRRLGRSSQAPDALAIYEGEQQARTDIVSLMRSYRTAVSGAAPWAVSWGTARSEETLP